MRSNSGTANKVAEGRRSIFINMVQEHRAV